MSLGGDSDTLAAITGSIAEASYGVPEELRHECRKRLIPELAVLYLTALPAIAHDSLILKNIGDGAIDGIMQIYARKIGRASCRESV